MSGAPFPRVALGELLVPVAGKKLVQQGWSPRCLPTPAQDDATWAVVKTTAIQAGWFDDTQHKELPQTLSPRPAIEIYPGDLLITCAGPRSRCGVPALVRRTRPRLMMSGKMYRFRPSGNLNPEFLEKWLLSPEAQKRIDEMKTGISDSGLNLTHGRIVQLPVPVPTLMEQRRIVEILEDHLSHLDAGQDSLRLAAARQLGWSRGVLQHWVWDESFELTTVGDVLREPMRNGRSGRASTDPDSIRTLTLTAVTKGDFTERNTKLTATSREAAAGLWLEPGDLFVQRSNTPELVGTSARYDGPREWAIFPDLLIRLRPDEARMDGRFLAAALSSQRAHGALRKQAKGLAGSMPKIDQRAVAGTVVPLPPRDHQAEIVSRLEELNSADERLGASLEAARRRGQALRRAVLATAFEGKLTGRHTDNEVIEEQAAELRLKEVMES